MDGGIRKSGTQLAQESTWCLWFEFLLLFFSRLVGLCAFVIRCFYSSKYFTAAAKIVWNSVVRSVCFVLFYSGLFVVFMHTAQNKMLEFRMSTCTEQHLFSLFVLLLLLVVCLCVLLVSEFILYFSTTISSEWSHNRLFLQTQTHTSTRAHKSNYWQLDFYTHPNWNRMQIHAHKWQIVHQVILLLAFNLLIFPLCSPSLPNRNHVFVTVRHIMNYFVTVRLRSPWIWCMEIPCGRNGRRRKKTTATQTHSEKNEKKTNKRHKRSAISLLNLSQ